MLAVNNNRQNFTARLDLTNIKLNKNRWDNISKMFAEKTQAFPYTFEISDSGRQLDIYAFSDELDIMKRGCTLSKSGTKKLMALPDEKITQKFIDLLDNFKYQDETLVTSLEFLNKLKANDKYGTLLYPYFSDDQSIFSRIFHQVLVKMNVDRASVTEKDAIFKDAKFLFYM